MGIVIKPMETEGEIRGKGYVHWKAWQETYSGLVDPGFLKAFSLEKRMEIAFRNTDRILVAKDAGRVIGFAAYGPYRDSGLQEAGEVYAIYILREYYGKGVGYALMNAAVERLKGYSAIAVWVLEGNRRAIRFYQRYGFYFDGTKKEIILGTQNTELRMILIRRTG